MPRLPSMSLDPVRRRETVLVHNSGWQEQRSDSAEKRGARDSDRPPEADLPRMRLSAIIRGYEAYEKSAFRRFMC
jgi:hypothetical protein